jgi:molybdopterin-guanine dinucleotide biosynthesis protein A
MRCTGAILAGGPAARFGGAPKGLTAVGGRRMIDRVAAALASASDEIIVVSRLADAATWLPNARVVADAGDERASLVGVHAALGASADGALVVAWDMPFVSGALLAALRATGERSGRAVVPQSARGIEPLCAYYPAAAATIAEGQLAARELRLGAFVRALDPIVVPAGEVAGFGDLGVLFLNVNDAQEAAAADRLARREGR